MYFNNEVMRGNKIGDTDFGVRAEESKTVYGATFGGPIIKDKLFFFANVEYEKSPQQVITWRAAKKEKLRITLRFHELRKLIWRNFHRF